MYCDWTTPVTEQFGDGLTHHVSDREAAALLMHSGVVRAVCGRFITPAPLSAPEGKLCPVCAANVGLVRREPARPSGRAVRANRGRLPGWRRLRALFDR